MNIDQLIKLDYLHRATAALVENNELVMSKLLSRSDMAGKSEAEIRVLVSATIEADPLAFLVTLEKWKMEKVIGENKLPISNVNQPERQVNYGPDINVLASMIESGQIQ